MAIVAIIIGYMIFSKDSDTSAQEMRLEKYMGEVILQNNSEQKDVVEGSRLVSKDNIETFTASNAYIS